MKQAPPAANSLLDFKKKSEQDLLKDDTEVYKQFVERLERLAPQTASEHRNSRNGKTFQYLFIVARIYTFFCLIPPTATGSINPHILFFVLVHHKRRKPWNNVKKRG